MRNSTSNTTKATGAAANKAVLCAKTGRACATTAERVESPPGSANAGPASRRIFDTFGIPRASGDKPQWLKVKALSSKIN